MFNTKVQRRLGFCGGTKIRDLKKFLFKTKAIQKRLEKRLKPNELIKKASNKLNNVKSAKCGLALEQIELIFTGLIE